MSSTKTDKNNFCFLWTNKHSQFGTFFQPSSINALSSCLSHKKPTSGCPCRFRSSRNHGIFNVWPWFGPLAPWQTYSYIWTFWAPNFCSAFHLYFGLKLSFPQEARVGVRTRFVQWEMWAACVVGDVSKCLDILTLGFLNNLWASSILTWV